VLETAELSFSPVTSPGPAGGPRPTVLTGHPTSAGGCLIVGAAPLYIQIHPGSLTLTAPIHGTLSAAVSRFAPSYTSLGSVSNGQSAAAPFPADRAPQVAWRMMLSGPGGRVCAGAR
jgi:hypothetical protein